MAIADCGDGRPGEEDTVAEGPFGGAGPVYNFIGGHVVFGVVNENIPSLAFSKGQTNVQLGYLITAFILNDRRLEKIK